MIPTVLFFLDWLLVHTAFGTHLFSCITLQDQALVSTILPILFYYCICVWVCACKDSPAGEKKEKLISSKAWSASQALPLASGY